LAGDDDCRHCFGLYFARGHIIGIRDRASGGPGLGVVECFHKTIAFDINFADKYPDLGIVHVCYQRFYNFNGFRDRPGIQSEWFLDRLAV
jgi:hypothetical protein